jgi:hypothetical protein
MCFVRRICRRALFAGLLALALMPAGRAEQSDPPAYTVSGSRHPFHDVLRFMDPEARTEPYVEHSAVGVLHAARTRRRRSQVVYARRRGRLDYVRYAVRPAYRSFPRYAYWGAGYPRYYPARGYNYYYPYPYYYSYPYRYFYPGY